MIWAILFVPLMWLLFAKFKWRTTINFKELAVSMAIVVAIVVGTIELGKYGQTVDYELWNGKVVSKEVDDGHYTRSYDCNCTQSCSGSGSNRSCTETCQTCYEDHYTRSYDGLTTVGGIIFDSIDSTSRSRRDSFPPPLAYKRCQIGEPATLEKSYTNYVQAVPQSLFSDKSRGNEYDAQVPAYPKVYDFYKIRRVLNIGTKVDAPSLNTFLSNELKTLGRQKQVNIIVILTPIKDPMYRYAVERKWEGGNKNDVVVMLGLDGENIVWADVMTWALNKGNELFHVTMRDSLINLKTYDVGKVGTTITSTIKQYYDRPEMKQFEYLKDEIKPPTWVVWTAIILSLLSSIILTIVFHRNEL